MSVKSSSGYMNKSVGAIDHRKFNVRLKSRKLNFQWDNVEMSVKPRVGEDTRSMRAFLKRIGLI
jgi:hypothetical protein